MPRGRPSKSEADQAVQVTITARARELVDEHLRAEWVDLFDRGIVNMMLPHYVASQRRAKISEMIEVNYGPAGQHPTTVEVRLPLPEKMTDEEEREVDEWSRRLLEHINATLPAPVRAAIAANEIRSEAPKV